MPITNIDQAPEVYAQGAKVFTNPPQEISADGFYMPNLFPDHLFVRKTRDGEEVSPEKFKSVLGHEAQHRQYHKAGYYSKPDEIRALYNPWTGKAREGLYENLSRIEELMKKHQFSLPTLEKLLEIQKRHPDKTMTGDMVNYDGFLAQLVGMEAALPAGKSIVNTPIGNELLTTPKSKEWFINKGLTNTPKLLPVPEPSLVERLHNKMLYPKDDVTRPNTGFREFMAELIRPSQTLFPPKGPILDLSKIKARGKN